jgi:predicted nucleic acid-binding protein
MLVVADTSPIIGLLKINHIDILPRRFGNVVIPAEVASELSSPKRTPEIRSFIAAPPAWLTVRQAKKIEQIPNLDPGELAAISLARELNADLLLIDESLGRQAAIARSIPTARTAALLFDAANAGILPDLKSAFDLLKSTNFRVPHHILDALLKKHLELQTRPKP